MTPTSAAAVAATAVTLNAALALLDQAAAIYANYSEGDEDDTVGFPLRKAMRLVADAAGEAEAASLYASDLLADAEAEAG